MKRDEDHVTRKKNRYPPAITPLTSRFKENHLEKYQIVQPLLDRRRF
jgi:hypothetical protein